MGENNKNEEFIEDPRYKQCNKEALIGIGLGILNLIWWFGWGYGLGTKNTDEYTYVMGLPMWFFMSCIVGAILFSALAILMVSKFFKDMPLGKIDLEDDNNI
ncbi:YhdT family protein [Marinisporobacter balticus]|uniref:Putative membrane protein YhdT n=1 Tax=Marinisporobacter balticus TaxID=2018667 RepID=A0A4R2KZ62_9FIRM|nr:YhdT family protein [Marinisporobacter balticus]TCO79394.1 putative membrane protein YhdT [Marinisporobacter balticus]